MFGMQKKTNKKGAEKWEFDLEKDLSNPTNMRKIKDKIEERIQQLKTLLRQGDDKKAFDDAQTLLHGYLAVQKVIQRIGRK